MAMNPFLMEDLTDYSSPTNGASSNPFLCGDFSVPEPSDNPFLNAGAESSPFGGSSTNPFADFGETYEPTGTDNVFGAGDTTQPTDYSDIFGSQPPQNDFFGSHAEPAKPEAPPTLDLMEDQNEFCQETSQIFGVSEVEDPASTAAPKRPPPPPRPTLPPSKETTDLIRSVTGAMEATSSHLLDRLQATRTPSPTDLRDLHTPSPPHFGDLLDAGEPRLPAFPSGVDLHLMGEEPVPTPAPVPAPVPTAAAPPMPRPPPPRPQRPPEPQTDMFDMFGTSQPARPPPPASNADILGLFNAPTKQEPKTDLLSDDFVPAPEPVVEPPPPVEPKVATPIVNDFTTLNEDLVGDSYPEVNDNIVKSESFVEVTSESVSEPTASDDQDTVKERSSSISDIVKPMIPESFVTNIPETFKSDFGIPEDYTSMHDAFGKTIDDGFNSEQPEFGLGMDDSYHADQPDTYSAVTESFADTFGSNVTGSYTTINENFGTTADDGFGSSQLDTYSAMPETFGSTVSDIKSIGDTLCSGMSDTYDTNASDSFGLGHEDPISAAMMSDSSAIDAGMTHDDNFNSAMSNRYGSAIPDNYTFGTAFGTTIQETFGPGIDDGFGPTPTPVPQQPSPKAPQRGTTIDFDDFAAKFDNIAARDDSAQVIAVTEDPFDPFGNAGAVDGDAGDAWGASAAGGEVTSGGGFGADESFDAFLSMNEGPPPLPAAPPPSRFRRHESNDSDEGQKNFAVHIKPRNIDGEAPSLSLGPLTALAPPPKGSANNTAFTDTSPRFNPFDKSLELSQPLPPQGEPPGALERTDSQETPPTPLFDEDVSQPLEDFPRVLYTGEGWEMHLRQPNKKKITGQRFWKKVFIKLVHQGDSPVLQLYNTKDDKDPFQELPLQACYSVSDIGAQQFDNFGKIFTVKLQYVFYKERPGVRPGQVTKAERITTKLSQFAAYAIQGDYQGCKEFGSDLKKLGLPVEHAPQISQLFKIGCQSFEDLKSFSVQVEESLFRLAVHRDRALNYKTEEVQITAVDELYVEQDAYGHVEKQIARVRLFFLGFLAGMPDVELGVNDMWRQGKEVVGRHDIIPVVTEEWIRLENVEFHACVQLDEYERTHVIKFKPPDACYLELMRFRIRPPRNRELPLQVKAVMCVTGNKVQLNCDVLVPGFSSRKFGQIPCEDIMIRFPIPECWIYLFRVEKHFRYGSVKSTHRRTGKVKGIERFLGAMETLETSLIEVTSGQAKYEHQHRAIVWRMSRLPKEGQGAYTTHNLVCRMGLTSFDQIPDKLAEYCYVEFTMPSTQASHMTVRSVSLTNQAKDDPPEKYVRQLARHEYRVGIEHTQGEGPGAYVTATIAKPAPAPAPVIDQLDQPEPIAESDSDSSN